MVNEETTEKEIVIKKATMSENISLLTREYGRGTDFICDDDIVN